MICRRCLVPIIFNLNVTCETTNGFQPRIGNSARRQEAYAGTALSRSARTFAFDSEISARKARRAGDQLFDGCAADLIGSPHKIFADICRVPAAGIIPKLHHQAGRVTSVLLDGGIGGAAMLTQPLFEAGLRVLVPYGLLASRSRIRKHQLSEGNHESAWRQKACGDYRVLPSDRGHRQLCRRSPKADKLISANVPPCSRTKWPR